MIHFYNFSGTREEYFQPLKYSPLTLPIFYNYLKILKLIQLSIYPNDFLILVNLSV